MTDILEERRQSLEYIRLLASAAEGNNRGLVKRLGTCTPNWARLELRLLDPSTFKPMEIDLLINETTQNAYYSDGGWCWTQRAIYMNGDRDHDLLFRLLVDQYGMTMRAKDNCVVSDELGPLVLLMAQCTTIGRVTDY